MQVSDPGKISKIFLAVMVILLAIGVFALSRNQEVSAQQSGGAVPQMTLSGAAELIPGRGLFVGQSGVNLCTNPSAGIDTNGGQSANGATLERVASGGYFDNGPCWKLTTPGDRIYEGMSMRAALGAWALPPVDPSHDQYQVSFYARLLSTDGPSDNLNIQMYRYPGTLFKEEGNLVLTNEWRLYTIGATIDSPSMDFSIFPNYGLRGDGVPANTEILIDGITLEAEKAYSEPVYGTNESDKIYGVPPYHGDHTGCSWSGFPHASRSVRTEGITSFDGSAFGIEFDSQPWWFGLDMSVGFDRDDSFETISKEWFTIGLPGDGYGWVDNNSFVLDYHSTDHNLYFHRHPAHTTKDAVISTPDFKYGDRLRCVGAWDPTTLTVHLWAVVGDDPSAVRYHSAIALTEGMPFREGYEVNLGFAGGWTSGQWQANTLHRNFVLEQGFPTQEQVTTYLQDPSQPLLDGGYHYPFMTSLDGIRDGVVPCESGKPDLSMDMSGAFWASYDDYIARQLSVNWTLSNKGQTTAYDAAVTGSTSNRGVTLVSETPVVAGDILPGGSSAVTLKYLVPEGVANFRTWITAAASDECGNAYSYPK